MPHAVRIFAADRRPMTIEGLACLIRDAPDLLLTAHGGRRGDLEQALSGGRADLVILDPALYGNDPADATDTIRRLPSPAAILFTFTHIDDALLRALGRENVSCVSAYSDGLTILAAIRSLARGRPILPHEVQHALAAELLRPPAATRRLTDREWHILSLAAEGLTAHAIASKLNISQSTAKTHLQRVYAKLGATNRSSAIVNAIRSGVLSTSHEVPNSRHTPQLALEPVP